MTDTTNLATMATDTVTPFGARDMSETGLTEDGKKVARAIQKLVEAIRYEERVAFGRSRGKSENAEAACRKRFKQLWKAIRKHGDCYLGEIENDGDIDPFVGIY